MANSDKTLYFGVVRPEHIDQGLLSSCGSLMSFMYADDPGHPVEPHIYEGLSSVSDVSLFIAHLSLGNVEPTYFNTDAVVKSVPFLGSDDDCAKLVESGSLAGQALLRRIGGFRDVKFWLEDFVVHPLARGSRQATAHMMYGMMVDYCISNGARSLYFTSAPHRKAAHTFYERQGAVRLAGDPGSPTNLFVHNFK